MISRIRKYKYFTKDELILFLVISFLSSFVLSFRKWGVDSFDVGYGVENLVVTFIVFTASFLVHIVVQKMYCAVKGINTEYTWKVANVVDERPFSRTLESSYKNFPYSIVIGLLLTVLTNGFLFILFPGWMRFTTDDKKRVGHWRYRPYFREYGYSVQWGIYSSLILAGLFNLFSGTIAAEFVKINLLIALFTLLPFPTYGGFHLFNVYGINSNFDQYIWITSFTIFFSALIWFFSFGYALFFGLVVAVIISGHFFQKFPLG